MVDTEQYLIGEDFDGVTSISLEALKKVFEDGKILEKIEIGPNGSSTMCSFIFKDHGIYNASGFSIGYGGTGPHGLHRAIRMFCPENIEQDFWETPISKLSSNKSWNWSPRRGFTSV